MPNKEDREREKREKRGSIPIDEEASIDPRFRDALSIIPPIYSEIFTQYFALFKKKMLKEADWKKQLGLQSFSTWLNPSSPYLFEKNPFTYLINAHNALVDLPSALNQLLKALHYTRNGRVLTREQFLAILNQVRAKAAKKNWLTPALKKVFRARMLYPLASTKQLATRLRMSENTVRYHTQRFRNRFFLYQEIKWDYYKLGLSRIFLFLTFLDRKAPTPALPLTNRYFEREIPHKMDIARDIFSIQIFTPPKNRWKTFQAMCETQFEENRVKWLTESPTFFYIEEGIISYNLDSFDEHTRQWTLDEQYIDFCLSTDLLEELPEAKFPPALTMNFDIDCKRERFDELDLKIIHYFYELEGNDNRFSTATGVAKQLGVAKQTVQKRLAQMLQKDIVRFFYTTSLRLPRIIDVILLTKNEPLIQDYLKLVPHIPFSYTARIRAYRKKLGYVGIYSSLYVPRGTNLAHILRDSLLSRDEVVGYSSDSTYFVVARRPLIDYWDNERGRWKWATLPQ